MGNHALEDRFWQKVVKTELCWLWQGSKNTDGYGRFNRLGTLVGAHRFSYELINGGFDPTLHVLHTCDQPSCVNPEHLFLGTHSDNMQDMYKKKRHGNGKLNICHPDRPYFAKGLCRACYLVLWNKSNPDKQKEYTKRRRS